MISGTEMVQTAVDMKNAELADSLYPRLLNTCFLRVCEGDVGESWLHSLTDLFGVMAIHRPGLFLGTVNGLWFAIRGEWIELANKGLEKKLNALLQWLDRPQTNYAVAERDFKDLFALLQKCGHPHATLLTTLIKGKIAILYPLLKLE